MLTKAIITTIDNLPLLKQQIQILKKEPIDEIIVVNNGSIDGTKEWLDTQTGLTVINRENNGAGPGRNSGLDAAGEFDYVLMLDGGIRPLINGTQKMLDYLENTPQADVIGVEIPDFRVYEKKAWRRWTYPIEYTYCNTRLSHTAYCLARYKAFDGIRFCEEGPFSEPGWGADDDEIMYQWLDADIVLHVVSCQCNHGKECTGVHPYRRGSGSFNRLFQETGIWPNQYGSVYEKRVVWLKHHWAKYQPPGQWGEPEIINITVNGNLEETIKEIKSTHDKMRKNRFDAPYDYQWKPYQIIVHPNGSEEFLKWAEPRRLRQHHGDVIIVDSHIIRRNKSNEPFWTGDFIICLS